VPAAEEEKASGMDGPNCKDLGQGFCEDRWGSLGEFWMVV